MAKPRNNIAKLSAATRQRLCELLDDGATYDEVRADEAIAAELEAKNLALHNASFGAYMAGEEFAECRRLRRQWVPLFARRRVTAELLECEGATDKLATIAEHLLMERCVEKLEEGEELQPKEFATVSGAVLKFAARGRETASKAKIAELAAQLAAQAKQRDGAAKAGLTPETLQRIEEAAGLL